MIIVILLPSQQKSISMRIAFLRFYKQFRIQVTKLFVFDRFRKEKYFKIPANEKATENFETNFIFAPPIMRPIQHE